MAGQQMRHLNLTNPGNNSVGSSIHSDFDPSVPGGLRHGCADDHYNFVLGEDYDEFETDYDSDVWDYLNHYDSLDASPGCSLVSSYNRCSPSTPAGVSGRQVVSYCPNNRSNTSHVRVGYVGCGGIGVSNSSHDDAGFLFPPGYRFKPYDDELLQYYLKNKIEGRPLPWNRIHCVELYKNDPDTLAGNYEPNGENEWYFFTSRDRKYPNGARPNRASADGFWKATGADKSVKAGGVEIGYKKSLVFYKGKPPNGEKTDWIMHEYRLKNLPKRKRQGSNDMKLDDWVLCRIHKNRDKSHRTRVQVDQNHGVEVQPSNHGNEDFVYFQEDEFQKNQEMFTTPPATLNVPASMPGNYSGCKHHDQNPENALFRSQLTKFEPGLHGYVQMQSDSHSVSSNQNSNEVTGSAPSDVVPSSCAPKSSRVINDVSDVVPLSGTPKNSGEIPHDGEGIPDIPSPDHCFITLGSIDDISQYFV